MDTPSYSERRAFWQRAKARLDERRRERAEQEAREQMSIYEWAGWLAEKAPTRTEVIAQGTVDGFLQWAHDPVVFLEPGKPVIIEGVFDAMRILGYLPDGQVPPRPISSARRTPTRDAVLEKIRLNTVDIEPVLNVEEMLVAHRNGATALERPMTIDEQVESPVWEELVARMWDPTHETGPRERDWLRQQHKRNQPKNESRAKRKGKR